jgi:hypothetical protein
MTQLGLQVVHQDLYGLKWSTMGGKELKQLRINNQHIHIIDPVSVSPTFLSYKPGITCTYRPLR